MKFVKFTKKKFMREVINEISDTDILRCNKQYKSKIKDKRFYIKLCLLIWNTYTFETKEDKLLYDSHVPFFLGINGSVTSGKSLLAKELSEIFKCFPSKPKVMILSTDDFLYSNKVLKKKGIENKKGFPVSYNWKKLFLAFKKIKDNKSFKIPMYNHNISDIDPKKKQKIPNKLDIVIVEGINILKPYCKGNFDRILLSDYLDYSIFIDAKERNFKKWFLDRLTQKKKYWKKKKIKKNFTRKNKKEFKTFANKIWNSINSVNLKKHIHPYRKRSDLIIYKTSDHEIKYLEFRL